MSIVDCDHDVLQAATRLSTAFGARDLQAAMDCFVSDDQISYEGSESGEKAVGRAAVVQLLSDVFARPEAYIWEIRDAEVFVKDDVAYLSCETTGYTLTDSGAGKSFSYRLCGLLQNTESGWRWRACHGCEPAMQ